MTEGGISEFIKWWIYLLLMFGAVAFFVFMYQVGQTNRFKSFVSAEIERGGVQIVGDASAENEYKLGFTPEAEQRIREENVNHYNNRYSVDLNNIVDKEDLLAYGDIVKYEVSGNYETLFSWFKAPILSSKEQAIIQVRLAGSDGERVFAKSFFEYDDFEYADNYTYVDGEGNNVVIRDVGVLVGFSDKGIEKYDELKSSDSLNNFIVPDKNPQNQQVIRYIDHNAFASYSFKGDFEAPNIVVIGDGAFKDSVDFNGSFKADNITRVGAKAFEKSQFRNDFKASRVELIGNEAFASSVFDGVFDATNVRKIGSQAFLSSVFSGSFNAPKLTLVGSEAFATARFQGYFNASELETIGTDAFVRSEFLNGEIVNGEFVEYE